MKKKSIQKRLLAALLAGIMCIGSAQVFSVEAKEPWNDEGYAQRVQKTVFKTDFSKIPNDGDPISKDNSGLDASSDCLSGYEIDGSKIEGGGRTRALKKGSDTLLSMQVNKLPDDKEEIEYIEGPRVIKEIDVKGLDNLTVEFDVQIENETENENPDMPRFYIGTIEDNDVTSTEFSVLTQEDGKAYMDQVFWKLESDNEQNLVKPYGSLDLTSVKLEFVFADETSGTVTAYTLDGEQWVADAAYTNQDMAISNGTLYIAFAAESYGRRTNVTGSWDKWYSRVLLDNIHVYAYDEILPTNKTTEASEKVLFETDFNNSSNSSLLNGDGWTAHSGGNAKYNSVEVDSKGYLKLFPEYSNSGRWAGPRIIKHLDVASFDKVTVNFDFAVYYEEETKNTSAPTFTVGVLQGDDVSKQYCEGNTSSADNKAGMTQVFWQYAARETETTIYWKSVKLEFEIIDNDTAKVTAYTSPQGADNWSLDEDYSEVPVELEDGLLRLAFVGTTYAIYHTNEPWYARLYMDNVEIVGNTFEKYATTKAKKQTLYENNFTNLDDEAKDLSDDGWMVSDAEGGEATNHQIKSSGSRGTDARTVALQAIGSENSSEGAGTRIIRHVDTNGMGTLAVQFKVGLHYEKEILDIYDQKDRPNLYVGTIENDDVTKRHFTFDESEKDSDTAYMEQKFWEYKYSGSGEETTTDWMYVKLKFEILGQDRAKVTAYTRAEEDDDWVVDSDFLKQDVTLTDGILRLAFAAEVYALHIDGDDDYFARVRLDDMEIVGTSKKQQIFYANETLFSADFETTTATTAASSLKDEGWNKGSYMFDNDGDGGYDVVPNQYDPNAMGALNNRLYIGSESGNKYLVLKSAGGEGTSRIQKRINAEELDHFVVEFDYKTVGEVVESGAYFGYFRLSQKKNQDMTEQHAYANGNEQVWAAPSQDVWTRIRAVFDISNNVIQVYKKDTQDNNWSLENTITEVIKDADGYVNLTFYVPTKEGSEGYLDNVDIYTVREYVDGVYTDVEGNKVYSKPVTLDGASVRLAGTSTAQSGIRFTGRVNKAYIDMVEKIYGAENVKFGVLVAPNDYVNGDFTIDALGAGKYLKIEGQIVANEDTAREDGYYEFRCAMVNLKEGNYGRDFAFRSYIEIVDGDNKSTYVYSDFDKKDNVRSMATIATMALSDLSETQVDEYQTEVKYDKTNTMYSPYTTAQRTFLENYCNYSIPLSSGSDIRVMSMNILDEDANDYAYSISDRAALLSKTILGYAPDVAGLQEVTQDWLNAISNDGQLVDYEVIQGTYKGGWFNWQTKTNETAILYNKNKVDVVEGQYGDYTNNYGYITLEGDNKGHTTTWAAMQTKAGEKFLFINAHPSYYKDNSNGVLATQWGQLVQFIATLKGTYKNFSVIIVGDFNTSYGMDEYKLAAEAGLLDGQDAVLAGDCAGGFTCDTWHTYGLNAGDRFEAHGDYALDHVFVDKNTPASFKYFSVIINYPTQRMSDHYPIYADIQLN